eukprot:TRINITY_DN5264_c0_g3_i2.p1 TRINITY_DN5264_c0_g3~~TRINITY_DN5264_c0_g3_i2.p1  ORF type:complete len:189 (-),score=9.09 TRINITY_DN5264_c0_g3_i2:351-917(-)
MSRAAFQQRSQYFGCGTIQNIICWVLFCVCLPLGVVIIVKGVFNVEECLKKNYYLSANASRSEIRHVCFFVPRRTYLGRNSGCFDQRNSFFNHVLLRQVTQKIIGILAFNCLSKISLEDLLNRIQENFNYYEIFYVFLSQKMSVLWNYFSDTERRFVQLCSRVYFFEDRPKVLRSLKSERLFTIFFSA